MNLAFMKYGPRNLTVLLIQASWGDTMSDAEALHALRRLNSEGSVFLDWYDQCLEPLRKSKMARN
jgi:hypothetical protein